MNKVVKAWAGSAATAIGGVGSVYASIPEGIEMPWYAWVGLAVFNGLLGFAFVWAAPRNAPPSA